METRPPDVSDAAVADAVARGWRLDTPSVAYLPVGFGSHHWSVRDSHGRQWFASVDAAPEGSDQRAHLEAALTTAARARETGLAFVVAPTRTAAGTVTQDLGASYALALYPHVDGQTGSFHDRLDLPTARELVEQLAALHTATPEVLALGATPAVDQLEVPDRSALSDTLAAVGPGGSAGWIGPYGPGLHRLLVEHAPAVRAALAVHDRLLATAGPQEERRVVTHGEPHPGNVIRTPEGLVLVDWDTTRLAPPERDLWHVVARLAAEDARDVGALYAERTGRHLQPALLERYRLAWALTDVAGYAEELRHTRAETADTATAWDALAGTLAELAARHTSPKEGPLLGQEVTTRSSPAGP